MSNSKATFEEFNQACLAATDALRKFRVAWLKLCMKSYKQGRKDGRKLGKKK